MTDSPYLTITLTGDRPVKIKKDDWPVLASAKMEDYTGQEHSPTRNAEMWMTIRQHKDGHKKIISAGYEFKTKWQGEKEETVRVGKLIDTTEELVEEIHEVAKLLEDRIQNNRLNLSTTRLAEHCIADLPAVELA